MSGSLYKHSVKRIYQSESVYCDVHQKILMVLEALIISQPYAKLKIGKYILLRMIRNIVKYVQHIKMVTRHAPERVISFVLNLHFELDIINCLVERSQENKLIMTQGEENGLHELLRLLEIMLDGQSQSLVCEILYRSTMVGLGSKENKRNMALKLFKDKAMAKRFCTIRKKDFDVSLRTFLNAYNTSLYPTSRKIVNFRLDAIALGMYHFDDIHSTFESKPKANREIIKCGPIWMDVGMKNMSFWTRVNQEDQFVYIPFNAVDGLQRRKKEHGVKKYDEILLVLKVKAAMVPESYVDKSKETMRVFIRLNRKDATKFERCVVSPILTNPDLSFVSLGQFSATSIQKDVSQRDERHMEREVNEEDNIEALHGKNDIEYVSNGIDNDIELEQDKIVEDVHENHDIDSKVDKLKGVKNILKLEEDRAKDVKKTKSPPKKFSKPIPSKKRKSIVEEDIQKIEDQDKRNMKEQGLRENEKHQKIEVHDKRNMKEQGLREIEEHQTIDDLGPQPRLTRSSTRKRTKDSMNRESKTTIKKSKKRQTTRRKSAPIKRRLDIYEEEKREPLKETSNVQKCNKTLEQPLSEQKVIPTVLEPEAVLEDTLELDQGPVSNPRSLNRSISKTPTKLYTPDKSTLHDPMGSSTRIETVSMAILYQDKSTSDTPENPGILSPKNKKRPSTDTLLLEIPKKPKIEKLSPPTPQKSKRPRGISPVSHENLPSKPMETTSYALMNVGRDENDDMVPLQKSLPTPLVITNLTTPNSPYHRGKSTQIPDDEEVLTIEPRTLFLDEDKPLDEPDPPIDENDLRGHFISTLKPLGLSIKNDIKNRNTQMESILRNSLIQIRKAGSLINEQIHKVLALQKDCEEVSREYGHYVYNVVCDYESKLLNEVETFL